VGGFVSWLRAEWDRAAGVGFLVAGAICLAVGYGGVAGATYVPQALSFIASGGFFGLLLVAVGATLLITAALHDEWRKLDRIEQAITRLAEAGTAPDTGTPPVSGGAAPEVDLTPAHPERPDRLVRVAAGPLKLSVVAGLAAVALLVGGWVATAAAVEDSTAYATILFGIAGLAVAGMASAGWTLSLRRANRARQATLLAPFGLLAAAGPAPRLVTDQVAVADGLTRFHVPGCPAVAGLSVRFVDHDQASSSGLARCPLCAPGR
jgi:hypothetical protein